MKHSIQKPRNMGMIFSLYFWGQIQSSSLNWGKNKIYSLLQDMSIFQPIVKSSPHFLQIIIYLFFLPEIRPRIKRGFFFFLQILQFKQFAYVKSEKSGNPGTPNSLEDLDGDIMANFEKLQKEASEVGFWSIRMCCSVTRRSNFMIMGLGYLTFFSCLTLYINGFFFSLHFASSWMVNFISAANLSTQQCFEFR